MTSTIQKVNVPEGVAGEWRVERFFISEREANFANLRATIGHGREGVTSGSYTKLLRNGAIIMSDTDAEMDDLREMIIRAHGSILINGLGLGVVLQAALQKLEVTHATVIEMSPDVIKLVGLHYLKRFGSDRLEIIEADAYKWMPPKGIKYDVVWHDVWDNICGDNWDSITSMKRKCARRCHWQGVWAEDAQRQAR